MEKFRNWNEKYKRFTFFEDGQYYYFVARISDGCVVRINLDNRIDKEFNWQNAEQEFERYNIKFFVGDKFKINDCVYGVIAIRNGVLEFDKYETCCDEYIGYSRITDYYINQLEKLGNIHEEKV